MISQQTNCNVARLRTNRSPNCCLLLCLPTYKLRPQARGLQPGHLHRTGGAYVPARQKVADEKSSGVYRQMRRCASTQDYLGNDQVIMLPRSRRIDEFSSELVMSQASSSLKPPDISKFIWSCDLVDHSRTAGSRDFRPNPDPRCYFLARQHSPIREIHDRCSPPFG